MPGHLATVSRLLVVVPVHTHSLIAMGQTYLTTESMGAATGRRERCWHSDFFGQSSGRRHLSVLGCSVLFCSVLFCFVLYFSKSKRSFASRAKRDLSPSIQSSSQLHGRTPRTFSLMSSLTEDWWRADLVVHCGNTIEIIATQLSRRSGVWLGGCR